MGEGMTRRVTLLGETLDPDAKLTKKLINTYVQAEDDTKEGWLLLPPGFARKWHFHRAVMILVVMAAILGFIGACFMSFTDWLPDQWSSCDFKTDSSCGDVGQGKWWWPFLTASGGLIIGTFKWFIEYPEQAALFQEIQEAHVDWKWSIPTVLISAVSLGFGAALGPEAAMGTLGGGLGTYVVEQVVQISDAADRKMIVLGGMACAGPPFA